MTKHLSLGKQWPFYMLFTCRSLTVVSDMYPYVVTLDLI